MHLPLHALHTTSPFSTGAAGLSLWTSRISSADVPGWPGPDTRSCPSPARAIASSTAHPLLVNVGRALSLSPVLFGVFSSGSSSRLGPLCLQPFPVPLGWRMGRSVSGQRVGGRGSSVRPSRPAQEPPGCLMSLTQQEAALQFLSLEQVGFAVPALLILTQGHLYLMVFG